MGKTLSEKLEYWRAERPDEWTMDEFIRDAKKLEAENAKLKQDASKIKVEAIREAAIMCCPVSGYVVSDDQARKDLMQYADFLEKTESE